MIALLNIKSLALLVWGLVNVALVASIGEELGWGESTRLPLRTPVVQPFSPVDIALPPDYRLPQLEKTNALTLERPLFVPSRRQAPPVPPLPPPPPPSMQKGQFQLQGTIIIDDMRIAVIKEISSGKERQVHQGYTINGILLDLVEPDRIVFSQYDDREELKLKIQRSAKSTVAAPVQKPAKLPVVSTISSQSLPPIERAPVGASPSARMDVPVPIVVPAQTIEDRAKSPLFKDFYK